MGSNPAGCTRCEKEKPQVGRSGAFLFFGLRGGVGRELSGVSIWAVWDCRPLFRRENKSVPFFVTQQLKVQSSMRFEALQHLQAHAAHR